MDDEQNILETYKRQFRRQYDVELALGPEIALEKISQPNRIAVIISDFSMPNMDGVQMLNLMKQKIPEAARILITGYADVPTAMKAVNEGAVFRFLTKPCPNELLVEAVKAGVEHWRLLRTEKDILEESLVGCMRIIAETFSGTNPDTFGRALRISEHLKGMALKLGLPDAWRVEMAGFLSPLGNANLPKDLMQKHEQGERLSEEETERVQACRQMWMDLIASFPRIGDIANIMRWQDTRRDDHGPSSSPLSEPDNALESHMLQVVCDYDSLERSGLDPDAAFQRLQACNGLYNPKVLEALKVGLSQKKDVERNFQHADKIGTQTV